MKPTLRAGANRHDNSASAYARVDILDQQDLFPDQGYQFPPNARKKLTNSYKVSEDSPFTTTYKPPVAPKSAEDQVLESTIPNLIKTERLCTRAAVAAIATGTDGELRPLHSKIVADAVLKERKSQLMMKEQLQIAKMKDEAHWAEVEQKEAEATNQWLHSDDNKRRRGQQALAETYKQEIQLHKRRQDQEAQRDREEANQLSRLQQEDNEKERRRLEKQKLINEERRKEFQLRNSELLMRKANQFEADFAEEQRIQKEHSENEKRMEQRESAVKKAREDKTRVRERLIDSQTKKLADLKAKEQKVASIAESEIEKREEEERRRKQLRQEQMRTEKLNDWIEFSKKKEASRTRKTPEPFVRDQTVEEEIAFESQMRKDRAQRVREVQLEQMRQRKEQERKELEEEHRPQDQFFLKDNEW